MAVSAEFFLALDDVFYFLSSTNDLAAEKELDRISDSLLLVHDVQLALKRISQAEDGLERGIVGPYPNLCKDARISEQLLESLRDEKERIQEIAEPLLGRKRRMPSSLEIRNPKRYKKSVPEEASLLDSQKFPMPMEEESDM